MAGYREFQTGEVLTAANVNDFLMDQSVMKFADAAARDTALGTAVGGSNALREGMVAYLDSTDEVLVYDGASWGAVGLPLGTATPTDGQILTFGTATSTWNPSPQLAGIGSNVVQTVKTDTFSTTSNSFVDVTGLTLTITPSSATSKILVLVNLTFGPANATAYRGNANLVRDSTTIATRFHAASDTSAVQPFAGGFAYLDSPATTNATTYKVQVASSESQTLQVGRSLNNSAAILSQIAAIEVAA